MPLRHKICTKGTQGNHLSVKSNRTSGSAANNKAAITGIKTKATLDLIDGKLTFEDDPSRSSISINYDYTPTTSFVTIPYDLMFEPGVKTFHMVAVIDGVEYPATVTMSDEHAGEAGYKHIVQLTIDGATLSVNTPQLTDWVLFETDGEI